MTTGYIDLGDGKLYYEMDGAGETLVLSHAGFVDSRMWDDQWAELTKHYRVIRYDVRGFGRSDRATGPVSRRRELAQVLEHLHIDRVHLLGCSLGGETVIDYALEHPDRVTSLVWERGEDEVNAVIQQRYQNLSLDNVRQTFAQHHERLVSKISTMSDADLMRPHRDFDPASTDDQPIIGWIVGNSFGHYAEHKPWIAAIVGMA